MGQVKQNIQSRVKEDFFNKNFNPNKQNGDKFSGNLSNPFASDQKYETETTMDGSCDFKNTLSNTSTFTVVGNKPITIEIVTGLKRHMKTHENKENPLQCIHCNKTFDSFEKLNKHKRAVHPKPKTATCKICFKKLCSEASLATHMLIHDDVKNYKCSFCFKSFRHEQSLKKHEQLHKNPKNPNQCVICQIDHKSVEELIRHNKRFHPKEKRYKCQECGKYLCSKDSLKMHQYRHRPSGSLHTILNQKDHQNTNHFSVNQKALFSQQAKTQGEKARNTTMTSDDNTKMNLTGSKKIFNKPS